MVILLYLLVYVFAVAFITVLFSTYGHLPFNISSKYTLQDVRNICLVIMTVTGTIILMYIIIKLDSIYYQQEVILELLKGK